MRKKKLALYQKNIKVELLGTNTYNWGIRHIDIKFSNGIIYACPPKELTMLK